MNFRFQSLNRYLNNYSLKLRNNRNKNTINYNYRIIGVSVGLFLFISEFSIDMNNGVMIISERIFSFWYKF